jgi:hypothetical protein
MKHNETIIVTQVSDDPLAFEVQKSARTKFDIIAWGAVFISLLSLGLSVFEGYETRQHDHLSVLPYLDVGEYGENTSKIGIRITNNGVGPAAIQKVEILFRQNVLSKFEALYNKLLNEHFHSTIWYDDFGEGAPLIPTGGNFEALTIQPKARIDQQMAWNEIRRLLEVRITYCSVYKECWQACLHASDLACPDVKF